MFLPFAVITAGWLDTAGLGATGMKQRSAKS